MTPSDPAVKIVSPRRMLIVLAIVCTLFAAMGVVIVLLAPGKELNIIVGTAAVGFFGVGGGVALVTQWRRTVVLRADEHEIRLGDGSRIPWRDVDRIGTTSTSLGVRLRRYDDFLQSAPRTAGHTAQSLRATRSANAGWDLVWPERLLDRPASDAARDLRACRPAG